MNVFISIIEEAYVSIKMKSQNHWIYSYLKLDQKYVEINNKDEGKSEDKNNISINQTAIGKDGNKYPNTLTSKKSYMNNTDQLYDKNFERMVSKVNSKNMLREILLNNENEGNKLRVSEKGEKTKEELEKILDNYFKNVKIKKILIFFNEFIRILFYFIIINFFSIRLNSV
jgi:hypothetical protein